MKPFTVTMPKPQIDARKIADLRPDPSNANKGSERGLRVLDDSIAETGLGRSVVTDKNGILIAGNKTQERAIDRGFEDAIVVHTTGKELVVVQRDDLDLLADDPNNPARKMAYYDNRAATLMAWDANQIAAEVAAGVDLSGMFTPMELQEIIQPLPEGWKEYDETSADDVEYCTCPECGHKFPK